VGSAAGVKPGWARRGVRCEWMGGCRVGRGVSDVAWCFIRGQLELGSDGTDM
jgi:hypothetical protein